MSRAHVEVPAGSHIRLVITGEESTPVDLSANAALLLEAGAASETRPVEGTGVQFALIDCSDDVTFTLDGMQLDMDRALDLIGIGVRDAIRAAVDRLDVGASVE